jgi:uncharacterized protein YlzI (FlbEa/FlbD family)
MAAGTDGLVDFTLIGGKTVSLNVAHIITIEKLTRKELQTVNFKKYGSAIKSFTNINKVVMSTGKSYIIVATTDGTADYSKIAEDTRATKSTITLSGGKF